MTYVSAGQPYLHLDPSGQATRIEATGIVLGIQPDSYIPSDPPLWNAVALCLVLTPFGGQAAIFYKSPIGPAIEQSAFVPHRIDKDDSTDVAVEAPGLNDPLARHVLRHARVVLSVIPR
jgi:hypothetical protein